MTGPLLKTGSLTAFHPVGAVGNPVYLAASQLRAAIARRLGADVADTFAIPQRNEDGDTVDWYAPQPGPVVPWSAASDAERNAAQERLLTVRTQIGELGQRMEAAVSSEQQVFGRLLAHVMSFPEDDDVHLVNGQPVLTFWGFVKDRAAVGSDPLRSLDMHLAQPEPPPRRGLSWWAWSLLGLLLLALLVIALLALRGCQAPPNAVVTAPPTATEDTRQLTGAEPHNEPGTPAPESPLAPDADPAPSDRRTLVEDRERTLTDIHRAGAAGTDPTRIDRADTDSAAEVVVDDIARDADATVVDADASSQPEPADAVVVTEESTIDEGIAEDVVAEDVPAGDSTDSDAAPDATAEEALEDEATEVMADDEALAADVPAPAAPTTDAASAEDAAAEPAVAQSETAAGDAEAGAEETATDATDAADAEKPASSPADTAGAAPSPTGADTDSRADPAASAAATDTARAAAGGGGPPAVRIPPKRLLNSGWRTSTTLLDPKDGSPIHLDYRLKDGAGKIRLQRRDGSVCESGAAAKVQDGRLVVDSAGEIVCADGTSFGRPQIDCTPQAGGKARCVGRYADGSTFPIDMQQQPE